MYVETTININIDILDRLLDASLITGESKRNIISSLMRRLSEDYERIAVPWRRIAYQKRDGKKKWKRLHVTLMPDEYEFFLDMRKACKLSVSRLVAFAVGKYLDEIIAEFIKGTDNYRYSNYTISYLINNGTVCLIHYWGIPEKPLSAHLLRLFRGDATGARGA
ncbi:MAG: hypothetical protein KBC90_12425 [Spirochaetes bacterium]|nr:hypothetical protein [Spirochaetota bacterium]HOD15851.1 hypothetical protein [Spirochaetota bacterium]